MKGEGVGPGVICSCLKAPLIWLTGVLGSRSLLSAGAAGSSAGRGFPAPGVPIVGSPLGPPDSCFTGACASASGMQPAGVPKTANHWNREMLKSLHLNMAAINLKYAEGAAEITRICRSVSHLQDQGL